MNRPFWQIMRFSCAVWSVGTFPQTDKEETLQFSWKLHTVMYSDFFLGNHPVNYPSENVITTFSEGKNLDFWSVQGNGDISTLWLLITLCNMPKGLVT